MLRDHRAQFGGCVKSTALRTTVLVVVVIWANGCSRSEPQQRPTTPRAAKDASARKGGGDGTAEVQPTPAKAASAGELGKTLYSRHCAACHGPRGDGKGVAAAYLFPKPRDFTLGKFRLVSTTNRVPSAADLKAVLLRGMPGSAMPPWAHLRAEEIEALVGEVGRLYKDGVRAQYVRLLKEDEGFSNEEIQASDVQQEIAEHVQARTTPGSATAVPSLGPPDDAAIARGKEIYVKQACNKCHGDTGRGDGQQQMADDEGFPTRPRDFAKGIFKGGHDVTSIYRRIAYGMPGTPMPSSASSLTPAQMVDLAYFTLSLSTDEQRQRAILKREHIFVPSVETLPQNPTDAAWSAAKPVPLRMAPLWWRDDADPGLQVQAVHDGKSIAIRLSWRDETQDRHAARSESFKDAVAMEVYRGDAEPFLGMGDPKSPIDVWYWDADHQSDPVAVENVYPNTVVDLFPFSEKVVASAELDRAGARTADQPDISLPARASGNPIVPVPSSSGASTLTAGGPGSLTFRIPKSQLVMAHGQWESGRWTVVMTRSLATESEADGVSLQPGGKVSVAFAVWDGARRDRDGKKSITIWQDLEFEE